MKLKRIDKGDYLSKCRRVRIWFTYVGPVSRRWRVNVDGHPLTSCRLKSDAVRAALAELRRRDGG